MLSTIKALFRKADRGERIVLADQKKSIDPSTIEILKKADKDNVSTCFSRAEKYPVCSIGKTGACCRVCFMGPCRFPDIEDRDRTGICGATLETIVARNLARSIAAGCAAHAAHGRSLALALLASSQEDNSFFKIKDENKLYQVAKELRIKTGTKKTPLSKKETAAKVAKKALSNFGAQQAGVDLIKCAPKKRQKIWKNNNLAPAGIDQEIVETMHQTSIGVSQKAEHILTQSLKASLADGWGGSMLATELSDILFGTPHPRLSQINLGVLQEDQVNIVMHGHEPIVSEAIISTVSDKELLKHAKSKGANGINLAGICCTSNEILMRHGIPSAGNVLQQELAIITGAVDAMVVDIQCIFQSLTALAKNYHTKIITTSPKAEITGATHIQLDPGNELSTAKKIVKMAIDNFPKRKKVSIPEPTSNLVAGFSKEYIKYMLGGKYKSSFRPLSDAIITGCVQGIVAIVGCNNPRVIQDENHNTIAKELIRNNILVIQTGCGALSNAKYGLLLPHADHLAGPYLEAVCKAVGIPPILHVGSCVDNSRILTMLTEIVNEGGLGEDICDLPVAAVVPEWMSEKALSIGTYFAASGVSVTFGHCSPVSASKDVASLISTNWEETLGGKLEFEPDPKEILRKVLDHIGKKRKALGIYGTGGGEETPSEMEKRRMLRQWQMRLRNLLREP